MRLLNTHTEQLRDFIQTPRYAILSHTWGDDEVTFKVLSDSDGDCNYKHLKGYAKIYESCAVARREGFDWIWIDTCCIDKSSSAELSEAINSMFNWYKDSAVCYAYLGDFHHDSISTNDHQDMNAPVAFAASRWFTRGWTLQELIAPSMVVFLNASWRELGTKTSLATALSAVTGIDTSVLAPLPVVTGSGPWGPQLRVPDIRSTLHNCSIAQRMSWAARRTTTRVEDAAYSLMGLFDINMPLLYGEGAKAFLRLQKEILNHSAGDDMSIFVWKYPTHARPNWNWSGVLAPSPDCFEEYGDVRHDRGTLPLMDSGFNDAGGGGGGTNIGSTWPGRWRTSTLTSADSRLSTTSTNSQSRTLDVSNTQVKLSVSVLGLRKKTEKIRAWSRTALLKTKSSLSSNSPLLLTGELEQPTAKKRSNANTSSNFLDLDQFLKTTSNPDGPGLFIVAMLDCWTASGQIGLVLVDKQPSPVVRHHSRTVFAPLLLSSSSAVTLSPPQDVRCMLFSDDLMLSERLLVCTPKVSFLLQVVKELGYVYCPVERAWDNLWPGGRYALGRVSRTDQVEFSCLEPSSGPVILAFWNNSDGGYGGKWPAFLVATFFEFSEMVAGSAVLVLEEGGGGGLKEGGNGVVELDIPTVQAWLADCRALSSSGSGRRPKQSQTRAVLNGSWDVVVKNRPSPKGIGVVIHVEEVLKQKLEVDCGLVSL